MMMMHADMMTMSWRSDLQRLLAGTGDPVGHLPAVATVLRARSASATS